LKVIGVTEINRFIDEQTCDENALAARAWLSEVKEADWESVVGLQDYYPTADASKLPLVLFWLNGSEVCIKAVVNLIGRVICITGICCGQTEGRTVA